jgi:hypothetical protein
MWKFLAFLSALLWPEGDVTASEDPDSYRAGGSKGGF